MTLLHKERIYLHKLKCYQKVKSYYKIEVGANMEDIYDFYRDFYNLKQLKSLSKVTPTTYAGILEDTLRHMIRESLLTKYSFTFPFTRVKIELKKILLVNSFDLVVKKSVMSTKYSDDGYRLILKITGLGRYYHLILFKSVFFDMIDELFPILTTKKHLNRIHEY